MDETQAEAVIEVINGAGDQVATKRDLEELRTATSTDLKVAMTELKLQGLGAIIAVAGLAVAIAKLF